MYRNKRYRPTPIVVFGQSTQQEHKNFLVVKRTFFIKKFLAHNAVS